MTITLKQAFELLEQCAAAETDGGEVMFIGLHVVKGIDSNIFVDLSWVDDIGQGYEFAFAEGANQTVDVEGHLMTLVDTDGEMLSFYLLGPFDVAAWLAEHNSKVRCE